MDLGVCWQSGVWANGSWVDGSWCPIPPVPPSPIIVEERRWPGPSITIYRENDAIPTWKRKREDEEIIIL